MHSPIRHGENFRKFQANKMGQMLVNRMVNVMNVDTAILWNGWAEMTKMEMPSVLVKVSDASMRCRWVVQV